MIAGAGIDYFNSVGLQAVFKIFWKGTLFLGEKFFGNSKSVFGIGTKHGISGPRDENFNLIT